MRIEDVRIIINNLELLEEAYELVLTSIEPYWFDIYAVHGLEVHFREIPICPWTEAIDELSRRFLINNDLIN